MRLNLPRRRIDLGLAIGALSVLGLAGCQMPGPAGPPRLVKHFDHGSPREFVDVGGTVFFVATDELHGTELWRSDGTPEGTVLLKDARPGPDADPPFCCAVSPTLLTRVGRRLFFTTDDGIHGFEPWVSDGTEAGTRMVEDLNPGGEWSLFWKSARIVDLQGTALFVAHEPVYGAELWRSDGTPKGTRLVRDIEPGLGDLSPYDLYSLGNRAYFTADDGFHGRELWRADGTETGTVLLADIRPGPDSSSLAGFVRHPRSGLDYFTAYDGRGWALWRTDGSPRGTVRVAGIPDAGVDEEIGGKLLLSTYDEAIGEELWSSDGTAEGTRLLKDICPGRCSGNVRYFAHVGDVVLFHAADGQHGIELWRTDGTAEGTALVRDLAPGAANSFPEALVRAGSLAYFIAHAASDSRRSLWMTDGTASGTQVVPGTEERNPAFPTASGRHLFFTTCTPTGSCDLWAIEVN